VLPYLSSAEEKEVIQRCKRIIESAVGTAPIGWFSPVAAPTVNTADLLAQEGFLWHGDYNDTDLPYPVETAHGKLVAIAHSDFTDNRTLRSSPRDFYNVYKDTFDYLYRHESPSLINLTVHTHFGGRPMMSAMLHELLRYMKGFPDVWFARHDEVARWTLASSDRRCE
jgi:peptidoglycan/xylan/chitin deacetylase (PgdA/CDA1 family)